MSFEKTNGLKKKVISRVLIKLLPCPFCGGDNIVIRYWSNCFPYVRCEKCSSQTGCYTSEVDAIESWNRRFDKKDGDDDIK